MSTALSYHSLLSEIYAFCDPASGTTQQKKASQARTAFAVVSCDSLGRLFVIYSYADRISPSAITETIIDIQLTYHPLTFGIESNAQQSLFAGTVEHELDKRGIPNHLLYVNQPTQVNKLERIRALIQPLSRSGRLFLSPGMTLLEQELRAFPTGLTVDAVDALASAIALVPQPRLASRPSYPSQAIADYLTNLGRPDLIPLYNASHEGLRIY